MNIDEITASHYKFLSPFSFLNGEDFSPFSFINGEDFSPLSLFYLLATHRPAGIAQICDFDRNITDLSDWVWSILGILICNDTGINQRLIHTQNLTLQSFKIGIKDYTHIKKMLAV